VGFGPLTDNGLTHGQVRDLTRDELRALKKAAGLDERSS
jgi:hypothetical protein